MKKLIILLVVFAYTLSAYSQKVAGRRIFYAQDDFKIYGAGSFGTTRDNPRCYRFDEKNTGFSRKVYISQADSVSNKGGIGLQVCEFDSANTKHASIIWRHDSLIVLKRATRGGANSIVATYANKPLPLWLQVERAGSNAYIRYSTSLDTGSVNYQLASIITGIFTKQTKFITRLSVASGSDSYLANARFKHFLSGSTWGSGGGGSGGGGQLACNCGFSIVSVNQVTNTTGQFVFNSCNVSNITWKLKAGSTILSTGTQAVTSSTIPFTIPNGTSSGTYTIEANANNCIGVDTRSFTYTVQSTSSVAWVQHPGGYNLYNLNGSIASTPLTVTLTGTNGNILSATSTQSCPSGYVLSSAIDGGNKIFSGNNYGWVAGLPNNNTLVADGRVHVLTVGCVGDIWGTGSNKGIVNVMQEFFKVGGSVASTISVDAGMALIDYHANFKPDGTKRIPQFYYQLPDFYLPDMVNVTSIGIPKAIETFDLRKRGFKFFDPLTTAAQNAIPTTNFYRLDPDNWATTKSVSIMNNATQAQAEAWATELMSMPIRGKIERDGEYRADGSLTNTGYLRERDFFKKAKEIAPNTIVGEHQNAPYKTPSSWYEGTTTLAEIAKWRNSGYTADQLRSQISAGGLQTGFWGDVTGLASGENAGKYMDIDVSAYTAEYNSTSTLYRVAWETYINRKYFPTKTVTVKTEGFDEVSVHNLSGFRFDGIIESWGWAGGGARNGIQPTWSGAMFDNVAAIANFIGGKKSGVSIWESTGSLQESDPSVYYSNNSLIGVADGSTNQTTANAIGTYPNRAMWGLEYVAGYMEKHSRIPSDIVQDGEACQNEISTDGGTTWTTGDNLMPLQLEKDKKPMAWSRSNTGATKLAILAMFPLNTPESQYSFKIRGCGITGTKTVTVNGQFPELYILNQ